MQQNEDKPQSCFILVAEDDEQDFFLLQRAIERSGLPHRIFQVRDGHEVIEYLEGQNGYADRELFPQPDLLILDLKMPRMNGFDVLETLRKEARFADLPVVVMSGSDVPSDAEHARRLGARDYYIKSFNPEGAREAILDISRKFLEHGHCGQQLPIWIE